ncbi:MAG TPA: hypothetical protein VF618_15405 [Thermoanaerobaculia bacterium]
MKTACALFLLLPLLAGCSTNDGMIMEETFDASTGSDVSVEIVGLEEALPTIGQMTLVVEISNNSDTDITVTKLRLRPFGQDSVYEIDQTAVGLDETIEEGKSKMIRVQVRGRLRRQPRDNERPVAVVTVSVTLLTGATYVNQFAFEVPIHRI